MTNNTPTAKPDRPAPVRAPSCIERALDPNDPITRWCTDTFWTLVSLAFLMLGALFVIFPFCHKLWELFFR